MPATRLSAPAHPSTRLTPGRRRRLAALLLVPLLAFAALLFGAAAPAQAAPITGAITDVRIAPTDPRLGAQLTTEIDWRVPNGTQSGDTFTLTLPSNLRNLPQGFALVDPDGGAVVANAVLSQTMPAVITFTMTDYASTHFDTHGTAFVTSNFSASSTPAGVTTPLTYTSGDGRVFTVPVTPTGSPTGTDRPSKYGVYTRPDQGRTNGTDFLAYNISTPVGPFESATTTDTVGSDQKWTFDCSTISYLDVRLNAAGTMVGRTPTTPASTSCSPTSLTVGWGPAVALHEYRVVIDASLPKATGVSTASQTFTNTARVVTVQGGARRSQAATAVDQQSSGGGTGVGVNPAVAIVKGDSRGNAADTDAARVTLGADGTASLVYRVTNTGSDVLQNVQVSDRVVSNGTVTGLSCDFSALGGPTSGTSFSGHFAVGVSFPCTANLSGVSAGDTDHQDVGTVTATGVLSGQRVTGSNAYFARVAGLSGPTGGTSTPNGGTTRPTAPVTAPAPAPAAVGTTGPAVAPVASDDDSTLAYTGTDVVAPLGAAGVLLALGLGLTVAARRRRVADSE
ncbi:hypothetical protein GCM10025867_12820 [Frondihabitans sucicola]|uniref:SDR-like Ig domain-containing protein n=1 Tax=Frondihabitans sucicola TaxID=1268041 RepID=A0ABN6XW73_9MICO|nr:Ig-like domain-containing protein [Frondihabitans sucicola]BDZ49041.1 hypothetical protein GCM10025867_12820 [Frondihabitans sucicola]